MLQTTCQEIADLYTMLSHKGLQGEHLRGHNDNPASTVQTH
jgi:hypothetical protein